MLVDSREKRRTSRSKIILHHLEIKPNLAWLPGALMQLSQGQKNTAKHQIASTHVSAQVAHWQAEKQT